MKTLEHALEYDYIFVDGMNQAAIQFFSKPLSYGSRPTGMVYGVVQMILGFRRRFPKAKIVFLWEGRNSLRKAAYASYKSNRHAKNIDFDMSLKDLQVVLPWLDVVQVSHEGVEADDLACYYSQKYGAKKSLLLVSNDHDWWSFVRNERTAVLIKNMETTYSELQKSLGFPPERSYLYKILRGDSSDTVSGIPRFPDAMAIDVVRNGTSLGEVEALIRKSKTKWNSIFEEHADTIKRNVYLLSPHPEWIDKERLHVIQPSSDDKALKSFLELRGMQAFLQQLFP